MKTKFLKLLTLTSLVALTSCGKETKNISLFIYDESDTFIRSLEKEISNLVRPQYFLEDTMYAEINQTVQNEQIVKSLENDKPDLLLVNIVDRLAASSIIEKATLANTPVIFFNREPLVEDLMGTKNMYYVGISPSKEGELQAKLINDLLGGPSNFLNKYDKNQDGKVGTMVFKGSLGHQDSELRIKNSLDGLKRFGYDLDLLSVKYCNWQREYAFDEFKLEYEKNKEELELVISANDDMALGVIDYLKSLDEYDFTKEIKDVFFPVVGNDATFVARTSVEKGELSGTIVNNAVEQARAIKAIMDRIFSDKPNKWDGFEYQFDNDYFIHIEPSTYSKGGKVIK